MWRVPLAVGDGAVRTAVEALSPDERERAAGFRFRRDAAAFALARAALRAILAEELGVDGRTLRFAAGPWGKPSLLWPGARVDFSVSRSSGLALVAVAYGRSVGVDLEWLRPLADLDAMACEFLSVAERRQLAGVAGPERTRAFYAAWTRKEARLKAAGTGLATDPRAVRVPLSAATDEPVRLDGPWSLVAFEPAHGYVGAVVAEGTDWRMRMRDRDWEHRAQ